MNQSDPKTGVAPVAPVVLATLETASRQHVDYVGLWPWLEKRIQDRVGYHQVIEGELEAHNGRKTLEDAWEEAADLVLYLTQEWMEWGSPGVGIVLTDARNLLLKISRLLWEQEMSEVLTGLEGGEHPPTVLHAHSREIGKYWAERLKEDPDLIHDLPVDPDALASAVIADAQRQFNEREEAKMNEHDPSKWRGDWCDCAACQKAAQQGFRRNSEPE